MPCNLIAYNIIHHVHITVDMTIFWFGRLHPSICQAVVKCPVWAIWFFFTCKGSPGTAKACTMCLGYFTAVAGVQFQPEPFALLMSLLSLLPFLPPTTVLSHNMKCHLKKPQNKKFKGQWFKTEKSSKSSDIRRWNLNIWFIYDFLTVKMFFI